MPGSPTSQPDQRGSAAFTLTELVVVLGVLAILAMTLVPALGRSQPYAKTALCQRNLKQLAAAWQMYSEDCNGKIVPNYHGIGFPTSAVGWVSGWLDWSINTDNTNVIRLIDGRYALLAPYLHGNSNLFKCPADQYLSAAQKARGWQERVRSYSGNIYVGPGNTDAGPFVPIYKLIRKTSEFLHPQPALAWVYVDEHPDSMNDMAFFSPNQTSWYDWPATYHNGGAAFAFADGRSEVHRWKGSLTSGPAIRVNYTFTPFPPVPAGDVDISWLAYRTPRFSSLSF